MDRKAGEGRQIRPRQTGLRDRLRLCSGSHPKDVQEKLRRVEAWVTVLKPTQVGETSSLRRSGEHWLRNSAKWPRNFGIRGAPGGPKLLGVSVNRELRLFIKNTGLCQLVRGCIETDACPVPVG